MVRESSLNLIFRDTTVRLNSESVNHRADFDITKSAISIDYLLNNHAVRESMNFISRRHVFSLGVNAIYAVQRPL
jgi:hypothetical protein